MNKLWPQIKICVDWKIIPGYVSSRLCPFRFMSLLGCVHSGLRFSTGRTTETLPQSVYHSYSRNKVNPVWENIRSKHSRKILSDNFISKWFWYHKDEFISINEMLGPDLASYSYQSGYQNIHNLLPLQGIALLTWPCLPAYLSKLWFVW